MAVNEDFLQFALDQLANFGEVNPKKMFGGVGLFYEDTMFGMVTSKNELRFRVDEQTKAAYEALGMKPMASKTKKNGMPYWEVPNSVLEDRDQFTDWAKKAYETALRNKKK